MADDDALLADPSVLIESRVTDPVSVPPGNVCRVERERAVDGSELLCRDTATEQQQSFDPDLITVLTLVDALMSAVGVARGAPGSARTASDLVRVVYAYALAVPQAQFSPGPVEPAAAGGPGPLTAMLRAAAGVSRPGPADWAEAEQLCAGAVGRTLASLGMDAATLGWALGSSAPDSAETDPDPEVGGEYDKAADEFWGESDEDAVDPSTFESEPDPPETDPWIAALLGAPTAQATAAPSKALALLRPLSRRNWKRLLKWGLPAAKRAELYEWVRVRRESGEIRPHSRLDGFVAEKALLVIYLLSRNKVAADVLNGNRVAGQPLGTVATAGSIWEPVRVALLSTVTNAVGQPDILDPGLRHVYEIKPKAQAVRGAKQLYGRYLLFLNAWEVFSAVDGIPARRALVWAADVLREFAGYVARGVPSHVDLSKIGPVRFWEPGSWTPPRRILLWDGRVMDVEVPIPGVLCYQILKKQESNDGHRKPVDVRDVSLVLLGLLLAQALADAARQAGGPPAVEALTRAAGDNTPGSTLVAWLAAAGAATFATVRLWQALSAVGAWLAGLAEATFGIAAGITLPVLPVTDPRTGAPFGLHDRYIDLET